MKKTETREQRMTLLVDAYTALSRIPYQLEPILGSQCGGGLLSDAADDLYRLIEYYTEYPDGMEDEDDKLDYMWDILHDFTISSKKRAKKILKNSNN